MPVDGLPNPALHRLCRRCRTWHYPEEDSSVIPASSGPVRWLITGIHRHGDAQTALRLVGSACQSPAGPSRGQHLVTALVLLAASAARARWLYSRALFDGRFDGLTNQAVR